MIFKFHACMATGSSKTTVYFFLQKYSPSSNFYWRKHKLAENTASCEPFKIYSLCFKIYFSFHLKNHHTKDAKFQLRLKRSSCLDLRSSFVYCGCAFLQFVHFYTFYAYNLQKWKVDYWHVPVMKILELRLLNCGY